MIEIGEKMIRSNTITTHENNIIMKNNCLRYLYPFFHVVTTVLLLLPPAYMYDLFTYIVY